MSDLPSTSIGLTDEQERLAAEEARLARNIQQSNVGVKGQAYLAAHGHAAPHQAAPQAAPKLQLKPAESWVDLHREYADILDTAALQTFRKHFQAFGNHDGYITRPSLSSSQSLSPPPLLFSSSPPPLSNLFR